MAARLTDNAYGKAFLWLVAIAIAILVEGFLTQQFGTATAVPAADVEPVAERARGATSLAVDRLADGIVELARLFRTIR